MNQSGMNQTGQGQEVLRREDAGGVLHSGIVPARIDRPVTGFMGSSEPGHGKPDPAYELLVAGRLSRNESRILALFDAQSRIPDDFSLQGVDQLVISDDRIHEDLVRLAAIRRWMHAGGQLWVMLDQADPQALERIAGDDFRCHVVDRVGLTTVRIETQKKEGPPAVTESEHDQPVDLMRVILADGEVQVDHTVNGWPAAFSKPFGEGRLLVTTLGARGWMQLRSLENPKTVDSSRRGPGARRPPQEPEPNDSEKSPYVLLPPMAEIAGSFFLVPKVARSSLVEGFEAQAAEYVGYSIPPRWQIAGLLAGFGGAVVVSGIWLRRRGALEHLGWIGPALSIAATAALLAIGGVNRHAIPSTAAVVDFVQTISGTDDIRSQGAVAFYRPEAGPWSIASIRGGHLLPDMGGQEGTTRRLVWSDLDAWSWQNLTQTAPQRSARFDQAQTLSQRIEARATYGPEGLAGRLSAGATLAPADAILATRNGQFGVDLSADGSFRVSADGVLGRDQYLAAGLLSDEQNRRRRTNELVLQDLRRSERLGPPRLLLWTDQHISDLEFDAGRWLLGATLLSVPLVLERPPVNTQVRIPSPLLDYRHTNQPTNQPSSPIWDYSRREWHQYPDGATVWLKFQLPRELLPIELTTGRLVISVTGPLGRLEVFGLHREPGDVRPGAVGGQAVSIHVWDQPVGTLSLPLVDSSLLHVATDGCVVLGFAVKGPDHAVATSPEAQSDEKPSYWKIEELSLELTGKVMAVEQ